MGEIVKKCVGKACDVVVDKLGGKVSNSKKGWDNPRLQQVARHADAAQTYVGYRAYFLSATYACK